MPSVTTMPTTGADWQQLREQRGLSVGGLAALTGLQASTIQRLEHDIHVTESTRRLVAAALGLPVFEEVAR